MNLIKIGPSFLAALLLTGTTLWARVVTQGVEQALLSSAIELCLKGIRAGVRLLTNGAGADWSPKILHDGP